MKFTRFTLFTSIFKRNIAIFRFVHKVISGGDDTNITIGPPEILLDMPYSMGCYVAPAEFLTNKPPSTSMSNLSPANCLINCFKENPLQRFVGNLKIILILLSRKVLL